MVVVGLYNLEPHIVNTAMMQVSQYHKQKGDMVEEYNHLHGYGDYYDIIYAFSIFNFTDKRMVTDKMIRGGSGFDDYENNMISKLPDEIEKCDYDWSLYPDCDFSLIWFSKGCIRNCPFCIVRQKEGYIYPVKPKNLNPNGDYMKVYDNNFFANPEWREAVKQLREWKQPLDFAGGIDVRLMDEEKCETLNSFKLTKQIKMAWDNPKEDLFSKFKEVSSFIKPYKIMVYVLIGYWSEKEQDIMRVEKLRELGIDPYVMPYNKKDYYQRHYARYVNHKAIFKSHTWDEYKEQYTDGSL